MGEKKLHLGEWSETKAVFLQPGTNKYENKQKVQKQTKISTNKQKLLQPGCEDMKHFQPSKSEDRIILLNLEEHLGMIAGVICGSLGLLSLLFAVLLCRRYNQVRYIVDDTLSQQYEQESSHYYDSEKYYNQSPGIAAGSPDMGGWEPGMGEDSLHSIPV